MSTYNRAISAALFAAEMPYTCACVGNCTKQCAELNKRRKTLKIASERRVANKMRIHLIHDLKDPNFPSEFKPMALDNYNFYTVYEMALRRMLDE